MAWNASPDWRSASPAYRLLSVAARGPVRGLARLRVKGLEHVPATGAALVASNHLSWADPILVSDAIPRPTYWMAKGNLFRNPVGRATMAAFGCIKVDRESGGNEGAVQSAVRALAEGKVVGIFPEGTRSPAGQVRQGRTGVARIAALSGAPVVPLGVASAGFWPREAKVPRFGRKVHLAIGEPVKLDLRPADAEDKQRMRDATDDVMARVKALLAEAEAGW